ncbi:MULTISPECIES: hypothetical protein [unclassified Micromonospora]|uniref:hypothetical protein n=1 Tax=unclassified Micromonospora TaxID=2617518 RepID=UPI003626F6E2
MAGRQRFTGGPGRTAVGDDTRRGAWAAIGNGACCGTRAVADSSARAVAGDGAQSAESRSGARTRP